MNVNLRSLVGKLGHRARGAVESAAGLCLSRTHYDVEVEHFLLKLLDSTDGDVAAVLRHFEVNRSRLAADLAAALDRLKSGNARNPALSPSLVKALTAAWTLGSVDYGATRRSAPDTSCWRCWRTTSCRAWPTGSAASWRRCTPRSCAATFRASSPSPPRTTDRRRRRAPPCPGTGPRPGAPRGGGRRGWTSTPWT